MPHTRKDFDVQVCCAHPLTVEWREYEYLSGGSTSLHVGVINMVSISMDYILLYEDETSWDSLLSLSLERPRSRSEQHT